MALWTPANLSTQPLGWYDAADSGTVTLSGSDVTRWANKGTASDGDLDTTVSSKWPEYGATSFNSSYPGITFDHANSETIYHEDGTMNPFAGPHAVFMVMEDLYTTTVWRNYWAAAKSSGGGDYALLGEDASRKVHLTRVGFSGESSATAFAAGPGQHAIIEPTGVVSTANGDCYFDGVLDTNSPLAVTGFSTPVFNGFWLGDGPNIAGNASIRVAEVIVLNYAPTAAQRQYIEGYLAHKWGTASRLPSTHPFKDYAPTTVEWTPTNLPDLLIWLNVRDGDADITYGTGSDVATWGAHGGTAYPATTLDTADRPTYSATAMEGSLPGVDFARNVDKLLLDIHGSNTTANIFNQAYSFGIVVQSTFTGDFLSPMVSYDNLTSDTDTIAPLVRSVFGSGQDFWLGRAGATGTGTSTIQWPSNNTTAMVAVSSSAAGISGGQVTADFTKDGSTPVSLGPVTGFGTPSKLGILLGYPDWDIGGGCKIGEFVFCDAALSEANRWRLEGYLAWNWGYQSKLPTTHPYYNLAPTAPDTGDDGENTVARSTEATAVPDAFYRIRDAWYTDITGEVEWSSVNTPGNFTDCTYTDTTNTQIAALNAIRHIAARSFPVYYDDTNYQIQQDAGGGTIYSESQSDSASVTDAQSARAIFPSTSSDSASITDTQSARAIFRSTTAETSAASDTQTSVLKRQGVAADSASIADAQSARAIFRSTVAESLGAADASTGSADSESVRLETVSITDTVTSRVVFRSTVSETLSPVDDTSSVGNVDGEVGETASITDNQIATVVPPTENTSNAYRRLEAQRRLSQQRTEQEQADIEAEYRALLRETGRLPDPKQDPVVSDTDNDAATPADAGSTPAPFTPGAVETILEPLPDLTILVERSEALVQQLDALAADLDWAMAETMRRELYELIAETRLKISLQQDEEDAIAVLLKIQHG